MKERRLTYPIALVAGFATGTGAAAILFYGNLLLGTLLIVGSVLFASIAMDRNDR